jgi:putative sterol carrier protein
MKGIFNTGEEWSLSPKCKRCKAEAKIASERVGNVITDTYTCPMCGETWQDTLDLDDKPAKPEPDPTYEADRQRFCYSKTVRNYADDWEKAQYMPDLAKVATDKDLKAPPEAAPKVQQLNAAIVEARINKAIEPEGYIRLELGKPELGREVVVTFSIQDARADRTESKSQATLKKLITGALEGTNWKLMSDKIEYRMGFLSGRLKGTDK